MTGWILALVATIAALGGWWWHVRRFARDSRQLREILGDLIEGREPRTFLSGSDSRFAEFSLQLEQLAGEQDRLRRRRSHEEINLQTILASMGEGVLVVDRGHVIRLSNSALLRILRLRGDPQGRAVAHAFRDPQFDEIVSAVLATGQPRHAEMMMLEGQPVRHVAIAATPMRDVSGDPAVVMIVHDVTRLKQLEDVRRQFVANVSHELRTPLAIFQGYLETLLENPGLPRQDRIDVLKVLQRHSTRLNLLVEDLLILARLESRSDALKLEAITTAEFLQQMATDWKLRCAQKEITVTVEVAPEAAVFWADRARLEQVLNNLVDNAVKYNEAGGHVRLLARRVSEEMELTVEDDGLGIAAVDLPHIFERFYRVDKARSRGQGGTGLGLSIVKHIAQLHGGSVDAESTYENGTRIIVRLPVQHERSHPKPGPEAQEPVNAPEHEAEPQLA